MTENKELKVIIFNVGEGDSAAIGFPVGEQTKWGLIDCCQAKYQNEPPVLKFLREEGIKELEFVCLTHLHYDHYRGLSQILDYFKYNNYPIHSFWVCGVASVKDIYFRMRAHARSITSYRELSDKEMMLITEYEKEMSTDRTIELGKIMDWRNEMVKKKKVGKLNFWLKKLHGVSKEFRRYGEDLAFHCLAPSSITEDMCENYLTHIAGDLPKALEEEAQLANLASVIIMVTFRNIRILFGGDAGINVWDEAIKEAADTEVFNKEEFRADLIKASHHGSRHSSSVELWNRILRKNALVTISASYWGNPYKHPHTETLEDLRQISAKYFPIRVACTNAPPICCKIVKLRNIDKQKEQYKTIDIGHAETLLRVLPGHDVSKGPSVQTPTCFGEMIIVINPDNDVPVSIAQKEGSANKCYYLSSTSPIVANVEE